MTTGKSGKDRKLPSKSRVIIIVFVIGAYLVGFGFAFFMSARLFVDVHNASQPRTFQVPFVYNFNSNSTIRFGNPTQNDIQIGLTFTYPQGTLVVDENVTVTGLVKLNTQKALTVTEVVLGFDNSLKYPITYNNGMAEYGVLDINQKTSDDSITGSTSITWPTDGDYYTFGTIIYDYGGSIQSFRNDSVVFHVYPKEQVSQISTNLLSVILTFALFFVGLLEVIDHSLLWWRGAQKR